MGLSVQVEQEFDRQTMCVSVSKIEIELRIIYYSVREQIEWRLEIRSKHKTHNSSSSQLRRPSYTHRSIRVSHTPLYWIGIVPLANHIRSQISTSRAGAQWSCVSECSTIYDRPLFVDTHTFMEAHSYCISNFYQKPPSDGRGKVLLVNEL